MLQECHALAAEFRCHILSLMDNARCPSLSPAWMPCVTERSGLETNGMLSCFSRMLFPLRCILHIRKQSSSPLSSFSTHLRIFRATFGRRPFFGPSETADLPVVKSSPPKKSPLAHSDRDGSNIFLQFWGVLRGCWAWIRRVLPHSVKSSFDESSLKYSTN